MAYQNFDGYLKLEFNFDIFRDNNDFMDTITAELIYSRSGEVENSYLYPAYFGVSGYSVQD